ncbi:hypothetical protein [Frigoriglobus tundricola]|uniref:hypothetical protein n=1 Tax=Frigoriglobus tundricola TaxID=2774151 RepID=UPI0036F2352C
MVEELFEKKLLSVALCTETLAAGINLPARSVVLTSLVKGPFGKEKPIDPSTAHQIFGRAGRPQFDTEGFVFAYPDEDDVRILRWKQQYDQIPENTKDPGLLKKKKDLQRKKPTRNSQKKYWTESDFERLKSAPAGRLFSKGPLPWRLLAYLLKVSPDVEKIRSVIRKRLLDQPRIEAGMKQLTRMLVTLHEKGFVKLEPPPPEDAATSASGGVSPRVHECLTERADDHNQHAHERDTDSEQADSRSHSAGGTRGAYAPRSPRAARLRTRHRDADPRTRQAPRVPRLPPAVRRVPDRPARCREPPGAAPVARKRAGTAAPAAEVRPRAVRPVAGTAPDGEARPRADRQGAHRREGAQGRGRGGGRRGVGAVGRAPAGARRKGPFTVRRALPGGGRFRHAGRVGRGRDPELRQLQHLRHEQRPHEAGRADLPAPAPADPAHAGVRAAHAAGADGGGLEEGAGRDFRQANGHLPGRGPDQHRGGDQEGARGRRGRGRGTRQGHGRDGPGGAAQTGRARRGRRQFFRRNC